MIIGPTERRCQSGLSFKRHERAGRHRAHRQLHRVRVRLREPAYGGYDFGVRLFRIPELGAPDVKLNGLLVAERRGDVLHDQLLLRDGLITSVANLAGGTTPESCHGLYHAQGGLKDLVKIDRTCEWSWLLRPRDEKGWRATFYTTGMEHSPTSATGTGWERTPWHAKQRAAWEALLHIKKGTAP